jgi:TolB-like protein
MKKYCFILFFIASLCFSNLLTANEIITVAVSEFRTNTDDKNLDWLGSSCSDGIIGILASDRKVRIVERAYLDKIIAEMKLQLGGMVDENSAVEIGRILGAQFFIFGSVNKLGENINLTARIVNVETTEIAGQARANGNINNLFEIQDELAKQISSQLMITNIVFNTQSKDFTNQNFEVYSKLDEIKRLSAGISLFSLDPSRRNKTSQYYSGVNLCKELIKIAPNFAEAYYYQTLFYLQLEDFKNADMTSKTAKSLSEDDIKYSILRNSYFLLSRDYEKAKWAFLYEINNNNNVNSEMYYGYALALYNLSDYGNAIEALIKSLNQDKVINEAVSLLRSLVTRSEYSSFSITDINSKLASNLLRQYWSDNTINNSAYSNAKDVIISFPNFYLPYLIKALYENRMSRFEQSTQSLQYAIKLNPESPEVHKEMAVALFNTKRCELGRSHLQLYFNFANYIEDESQLMKLRDNCR